MSQKSKADGIGELYHLSLGENEVVFMYLDYSGVIVRTSTRTVVIDPANLLQGEEVNALQGVDLLLFTHSHGDHYRSEEALNIFNATGAPILAEPLVADDLIGKMPSDKLTSATPGGTYVFGDITVHAVQGVHGCPINLYKIQIGEISIFHAGDSGYVPVEDYPVDLAFLPTGILRPFIPTSSPENALKLASELKPSVVVTIHGSTGHSKELESAIQKKMPNTTVIIPEQYLPTVVSLKHALV